MRKILMLTTLALPLAALSFAPGALAQSNSAPQPGLPPGAAAGAPNARPPMSSGDVGTARVGPSDAAAPADTTAPMPMTMHHGRHHGHHHHRSHHMMAPATPEAAPSTTPQ